ncbi:MAG: endodeoxyribonuclease RusA [Pseudomonas sp.]
MQKNNEFPVVELPWPSKELSPNARVHWAKKSKAAKIYRITCLALTLESGLRAPEGKVLLDVEFCPPDRRRRDDDNCLASFKSGRDGVADALRIDDSRFVTTIRMGEPKKGGAVLVRIAGEVSA